MDTIQQWGFDQKPFNLTCGHCLKHSKCEAWEVVNGMPILDMIKYFKFKMKLTAEGGAHVFCSSWCRWRHGKRSGIHRLLNKIGHKSDAFKE